VGGEADRVHYRDDLWLERFCLVDLDGDGAYFFDSGFGERFDL